MESLIASYETKIYMRNSRRFKGFRQRLHQPFEIDAPVASSHGFVDLQQGELLGPEVEMAALGAGPVSSSSDLLMAEIPGGMFQMGSPDDEEGRTRVEGPQHMVRVERFFMARTPVTQAQWKAVAGWRKVKRELEADPSFFKGENRPVENVKWYEAIEFCARLTQRTGSSYRLPSEAQWEFACRAGTSMPFHFGPTLSADLANYDATMAYGPGEKGPFRAETTSVGTFPANAWGLYDMHGNVWEWCLDPWHEDYNNPLDHGCTLLELVEPDGRVDADPEAEVLNGSERDERRHVLRGGSWFYDPSNCRSACRVRSHPVVTSNDVGFRVCCLPRESLS